MELFKTIQLNLYSLVILALILFNKDNIRNHFLTRKIFLTMVMLDVFLILSDSASWCFNGRAGSLSFVGNWVSNLILYLLNVLPSMCWFAYVYYQVCQDKNKLRRFYPVFFVLFLFNSAATLLSLKTGWFFTIDAENFYHRGPLFLLHFGLCYFMMLITFLLIAVNRKLFDKKYYRCLLLFPLPQLAGTIVQVAFYGVSLIWSSAVLSILIVYFNIQDLGLSTDYLTGVFNRRQLDKYLKSKVKNCSEDKSFSAILIDMDKFKQINDTLGHHIGDEALLEVTALLRSALRSDDFVARYGGDEFFIVLDVDDRAKLKEIVGRIDSAAANYNADSRKPYEIQFSMGYDIYNCRDHMKAEDFIRHIDSLMYQQKNDKSTHR